MGTSGFEFMENAIQCLFSLAALPQRSLTCYLLEKNNRALAKRARYLSDLRLSSKNSNICGKSTEKNKELQDEIKRESDRSRMQINTVFAEASLEAENCINIQFSLCRMCRVCVTSKVD